MRAQGVDERMINVHDYYLLTAAQTELADFFDFFFRGLSGTRISLNYPD